MLARAVSTAFATPAAAPNTASPPGSARSRPGSARHVASPTRSDRPLPGPHAQIDGRSAAHMPSQPRSAALRQPVARQRPSVLRSGRDRRTTGLHGPSCRPRTSLRAGLRPAAGPACRLSAACADRSGTPGTPTPAPRSVPGGANAGLGTYARACGVEIFRKKNQRDGEPPAPPPSAQFPVQRGRRDIGSRAGASDFPEAGWRRGGAPGARTGRCARGSIQAWSWLPALRRRQYVKRHTVRSRRSSYSLPSRGWSCCAPQWPLGRASVPAGRGLAGQQPAQHPHGAGPSSASAPASSGAVDCSGNRCTPERCYIIRRMAAKVLPEESHSGEDRVLEHGVSKEVVVLAA